MAKKKDKLQQRRLVENLTRAVGNFGGFSFGGQHPQGVTVHKPLPAGTVFPNGAKAAILMTFDVEGNYGNGIGDIHLEIANYKRICTKLEEDNIAATFNVVGKMAEDHGPEFVQWMLEAGCEVASHGYWHDMNKHYGGDKIYAGHYGSKENHEQISKGVDAINKICPDTVHGVRIPYGHFNEFTYDAMEQLSLDWASNVGIDDFIVPQQGFGNAPFRMQLGDKIYPVVEIPLDSQTFDWSVWMADEKSNETFVKAVRAYCEIKNIPFVRTPQTAAAIWKQRIADTIENETVFTLVCHPTNLAVKDKRWSDPVEEFLFPVIEQLGRFHRQRKAWVCTCAQLAEFYWSVMKK